MCIRDRLSAVKDYINGKGSLADISLKYNLSCTGILTQWINKYNKCHKTCKSHNNKGDHIMTNGRKTTYEERIEIVAFCIANANDYNLTANKYKVSYQQVYTWINTVSYTHLDVYKRQILLCYNKL